MNGTEVPQTELPAQSRGRTRGRPSGTAGVPTESTTHPAPVTDNDFRGAITMLTKLMAAQTGRQNASAPGSSSQESSVGVRIRDFLRMNPPVFTGSKAGEDPQNFIDEVWKILKAMHATETEGVELISYQLKDVANI